MIGCRPRVANMDTLVGRSAFWAGVPKNIRLNTLVNVI